MMPAFSARTVNDIRGPEVATIPAGEFLMGSEDGRANERPEHRVWVDTFALAVVPVTREDYALFLEATQRSPTRDWDDPRFGDPLQPAVATTWFDAVDYCLWLSEKTARTYRLPTEAEREKASRGGEEGKRYPWGDDLPDWMNPHYRGDDIERPDRVGCDPPNSYGLHNMADLVHEWCADWYAPDYYLTSPARNPTGAEAGVRRASRGGAWRHLLKISPCSARSSIPPNRAFTDYGFRVALTIS